MQVAKSVDPKVVQHRASVYRFSALSNRLSTYAYRMYISFRDDHIVTPEGSGLLGWKSSENLLLIEQVDKCVGITLSSFTNYNN